MISKLFVDGTNLFHGIADLLPAGSYFDFSDLLSEVRKDYRIDSVQFYASYQGLQRASSISDQQRTRAQNEFLNSARQIPGLSFYPGYYSPKGKEKGVDVHLAVDMVKQATMNELDQAIIMTGDDDLIYPVQVLKQFHKQIHLAAFCTRYPFGIAYHVNQCILYDYNSQFLSTVFPKIKRPPRKLQIRQLPTNLPIRTVL